MRLNLFLKPGDLVFSRKHKRQGKVARVTKTCAFVVFGSHITPAWCSKKQLTRIPNFRIYSQNKTNVNNYIWMILRVLYI